MGTENGWFLVAGDEGRSLTEKEHEENFWSDENSIS